MVRSETNPDSAVFFQSLIEKYGGNVFTVNAFTEVRSDDGTNSKSKWLKNIGTAFSFGNNGHLITFKTVIKNSEKVTVISSKGIKSKAQVIGCDNSGKINVLKLENFTDFPSTEVKHCKNTHIGEEVFLLGINGSELTVTQGIIREIRSADGTLIVSIDSNPGTSGTPVFDKNINLLGFLVYQVENNPNVQNQPEQQTGLYLVVTSEFACTASKLIINKAEGKSGWIGIASSIQSFGNTENNGVIIQNIIKNSPAEKSGLVKNDRIIMFNDVKITSFTELVEALSETKVGEIVHIQYVRDGKTLSSGITLSSYPENQ
ncbi:S1C family serine protease [Candidatus Latescibacterota bacterium]